MHCSVNEQWTALISVLRTFVNTHFPVHKAKKSINSYPSYIIRALNHKKLLWRDRFALNGRQIYNRWANKCKAMINKYYMRKEDKIINSRNIKSFFNYAKKKMHSHAKVCPLIDTDGSSSFDDQHESDTFNNFFSTIFTNGDGRLPTFSKATEVRSADDINFSPMAVSRALKKLKPAWWCCWSRSITRSVLAQFSFW